MHSGEEFSARAGEGTELVHDLPVLLRIPHHVRRSIGPLLPQTTGGKVSGCSLGPKDGIEVKQCAESKGLVVDEVGLRQVAIKVSADQIGVRAGAESGKSDAVGPAVGAFAGQQELADATAELGPASYNNQRGGSPTLSPTAFEKDAELSGSDLPGSLDRLPQLDRGLIRKRLRDGRETKGEQGGYAFGAPAFGKQPVDNEVVDLESEKEIEDLIVCFVGMSACRFNASGPCGRKPAGATFTAGSDVGLACRP